MRKHFFWFLLLSMILTGCDSQVPNIEDLDSLGDKDSDVQKDVMKESVYNVNTTSDIRIQIVEGKSDEKKLTIQVVNESDWQIMYGNWYVLEVLQDGKWYYIPTQREVNFNLEAYLLSSRQAAEKSYAYADIYDLSAFEKYRIVIEVSDENKTNLYLSDEFEISVRVSD